MLTLLKLEVNMSFFFQTLFLLWNRENVYLQVRCDLGVSSRAETNHIVDGVANQPKK